MLPVLMGTLGTAKTITGYRSEVATARGQRKAGRDSLLTARYNINQRKLNSRQTQFSILETGQQAASQIQGEAKRAEASAMTQAGSSGAIVGEGTPRAVLTNIAQEGLHAQMDAILNTKKAIQQDVLQTEMNNKTEWNQANAYASGMKRDAKRTMDKATMNLVTDIAGTALSTYSAGTAGGTKKFSWGIGAAKTAGKAYSGTSTSGAHHKRSSASLPVAGGRPGEKMDARGIVPGKVPSSQLIGKGSKPSTHALRSLRKQSGKMPGGGKYAIKGYSMDKQQPTGGKESSKTFDRLMYNIKHREFRPGEIFNSSSVLDALGIGNINKGKMGQGVNLLKYGSGKKPRTRLSGYEARRGWK